MARRFLAGFMAVLMAWSSASSSVGEMSYWKDRRQAVQSRGKTVGRSDIQLAALGAMALPPDGLISSRYSPDVLSQSQISFPVQSPPNAPKNPSDAVPESVLKFLRALPVDAGTVRTISLPSGSIKGVVIHIQDIHENGEAQANISRAVRNLLDSKTVGLVGLEGAFAPLDLENYRRFSRRETLRLVADDLLARHVISGPVHAGFLSAESTVPFLGVDQEVHHRRNVDAYRHSLKIQAEDQRALNQAAQLLEEKKEAHFSPALRRFDLALHDYRAGKTGLAQHVETLANLAPRLPPQVRIFHEAVGLEKHLDFAQAERERTKVLERLVQSLSEKEISDLTVRSAEFRMGRLSRGAFYGFLKHVCKISGLTLESYPAFNDYLTYVLLVQNIRMENLQTDLAQLEQEISHRLARTTVEKDLLEESDRLYFLSSLTRFTLSSNEWEQYKAMGSSYLLPSSHRTIYESFYREAEIRDDEMSNGLLDALKTRKIHSAVLVAGGFHGSGIQRRLTHQGMAVVDYVPKITKVAEGNGSAYLSVFAQEKTPLEQLFAAEQLFVAKPPMAKTTAFETAGEVTAFENGKPGGMSKEMVALSFLPRTLIARIKKIDVALKKGTSSATYYFSDHAWKFSCVFENRVPSFSQGPVTDGNRYTEFMAKMGAAVLMAFAVILFQWMLKSVFGLEWKASAPTGPFSWALFYLAGMSPHLFHADPRPTQAGLLQAPFVRYFMGEKKTMNPGSLFEKGVYAGSGLDISSYLLSTNCIDSYFLTSDPAVEYESLIELPQIQINNSDTAESWFIEKYRNQKWTVGFSSSDLFEKATPKQVIQVLALELVAIGVDPSRVTVDRNRGYPRIRFPWRYEGEEEKLYSITFVNADVVNPKYYPPLLTELGGIDVFFLKAGFFLPFHFNKYLPWWREKMTDGGFFAIDPHAVPPDSLFDNFSKMVVVPIPPMNGVTSVPLLDEITLTREMMDALETSFNIGLAARLRPWRTKFDRTSPNFTYGHVLKLLKVKNSPRANLTAPNTLERFWSAWNRIRGKEVGAQEMVTQQAPWESYWVAVLAGVTVPILTAFGLSPLWAGMWGAAWGLAHAAGTFDRDLNKISGWKAFRTSLAKAVVGLIWVSLYAWGLDALLSQLPLTEYLARFAVYEKWGISFGLLLPSNMFVSLFIALLVSSQIVGPLVRLVHSQLNKRGFQILPSFLRNRSSLAFSGVIFLLSLFVLVEFVGLSVLLTVFQVVVTAVFWGNLMFSLYFLWLSHKYQHIAPPPKEQFHDLPKVTIQLPMFNEANVAERIIRSAADVDYPMDKLEIQVLDDSTDETIQLVEKIVNELREEGKNVVLVHRTNRGGYKAGALKEGMRTAQGEFIAIFDADFVVPKDFLMRTIHHFTDEKVAMVEGRWGHLNRNDSFLTQAQATWLDAHMFIEQGAKNQEGLWVHFHGTGGVWRKSAIEDAGGWLERTVTEDGDLSYRALLKGWRMVYLRDYASPAELPPTMQAYLAQQYRWHKGGAQVLKFLLGDLLKSRYSAKIKLTALHRLTNPFLSPVSLFSILLLPFVYAYGLNLDLLNLWWGLLWFVMTPAWLLIEIIIYRDARLNVERETWRGQPFFKRWSLLPVGIMLNVGTIVHKSWAVVDAIFGKSLVFVRTPKYNSVEGKGVSEKRIAYKPERIKTLELFTLGAALYTFAGSLYFGLQGVYAPAIFFLFNSISFAWIGLTPFLEGRQAMKQNALPPPAQTPLAYRTANLLERTLPWPWITRIVQTGRGMLRFFAKGGVAGRERHDSAYPLFSRHFTEKDRHHMEELNKKADQILKKRPGELPVVARLVDREGRVVATSGRVLRDSSKYGATHLHAEAAVLREAARGGFTDWEGATVYVNLEPCLKCGAALTQFFRVGRVVYGIPDRSLHTSERVPISRYERAKTIIIASDDSRINQSIELQFAPFFKTRPGPMDPSGLWGKFYETQERIGGASQVSNLQRIVFDADLWGEYEGSVGNEPFLRQMEYMKAWLNPQHDYRVVVVGNPSNAGRGRKMLLEHGVFEVEKLDGSDDSNGDPPSNGLNELEKTKQASQETGADRREALKELLSELDQHPLASLGVGEKFGPPESLGWAAANFLADQVRRPSFVQGLKNALVERGIDVSNIKAVRAFFASLVPHRAHLFFISRSTELTEEQWQSLSRTLRSRYKPGEGLIVVPQGMDERLAKTLGRFELSQYIERASPDAFVRSPSGVTWVLPLVERGAKIKKVLAQQPLVTLYASPGVSFDRAGVVSDNLAAASLDVKRLLDALESLPLLRTRSEIIGILTRAVQESA